MGARGPLPRPALQVLRGGNSPHAGAGELEDRRGLQLAPTAPPEPDWLAPFPPVRAARRATESERAAARAASASSARCRKVARATWRRVVPSLDDAGILAAVDLLVLKDLAVVVARLDEAERILSQEGLVTPGGHRHPASILTHQLRGRLDRLTVQLGLSPVARLRMNGVAAGVGPADDEDSPFDV